MYLIAFAPFLGLLSFYLGFLFLSQQAFIFPLTMLDRPNDPNPCFLTITALSSPQYQSSLKTLNMSCFGSRYRFHPPWDKDLSGRFSAHIATAPQQNPQFWKDAIFHTTWSPGPVSMDAGVIKSGGASPNTLSVSCF